MEKNKFTINMRAGIDPTFSEFLLCVGNTEEPTIKDNFIPLREHLFVKYNSDGIAKKCLINKIYPSL